MRSILTILFFASFSLSGQNFKKVKLADNIKMKVPETLEPMTQIDLNDKYAAYRMPIAALTDETRQADLIINSSSTFWRASDLGLLKDFYKSTVEGTFNKIEWESDTIVNINKRDYALLEFESYYMVGDDPTLKPIRRYHQIYYTIFGSSVLIFNFQCPIQLKKSWQGTFTEMMQTAKVK